MNMTDKVARATLALHGKVRFSMSKPVDAPDDSAGFAGGLPVLAAIPEPILERGELYSSMG